jgi:predicted RNA-binding protein
VRTKLQTLSQDTFEISSSSKENTKKISLKIIPFKTKDAYVLLTERTDADSKIDRSILSQLNGYTDADGNILPYLFVEGLSVYDKGNGNGKRIMEEIIKIAKEKYGGRLILKPENKVSNPSPFYAKCGLVSTTSKGAKEITDFFGKGIPFASGNSDPMYLPIK